MKKKLLNSILIATLAIFGLSNVVNAQVSVCNPYQLKNIVPEAFGNINGIMLIIAQYDGLWKSDGTAAGTVKINAAPQYLNGPFAILGNAAYFTSAKQIWKTDGTEIGTVMVMDIPNVMSIGNLVQAGNFLFFLIQNNNYRNKLWKTDGTEAGTSIVKDIDPSNSSSWDPRTIFAYNDKVYFKAGNSTYGTELWKSDGTDAGTVVVKDVNPGSGDGTSWLGSYFAIYNNELYYYGGYANSGEFSYGLWKTNGTSSGTLLVKTTSFQDQLAVINSFLYFFAYDEGGNVGNSLYGEELWRSDGTTAGTYMVKDIKPGTGNGISSGSMLANINGKVVFGANDGSTGVELWASDGTASGTQLLKDIFPGAESSLGNYFNASAPINGYIYFGANKGFGYELWVTDGTSLGTSLVSDIWPATSVSSPYFYHIYNANLYYRGSGVLYSCGNSLGIQAIQDNPTLSIYPNPSYGIFQLTFDNMQSAKGELEIYNVFGEKVYAASKIKQQMQIDLSALSRGIYFIKVYSGTNVYTQKIIIQ